MLTGATAVVWSANDPVQPAKLLTEFAKDSETFKLKGGVVDGSVVQVKDVEALAKLPSREELLSKLLALINAPATQLLRTINAPGQQLVTLLSRYKDKLEKGAE
jgi:large subunit ribosomal protein L10